MIPSVSTAGPEHHGIPAQRHPSPAASEPSLPPLGWIPSRPERDPIPLAAVLGDPYVAGAAGRLSFPGGAKEDVADEVADEIPEDGIPEEMGGAVDGEDEYTVGGDCRYRGEEPAEEFIRAGEADPSGSRDVEDADPESDPALGEAEAEAEGGDAYRLIYSGIARGFTVADLSPACRYRFRLRLLSPTGPTGWSETRGQWDPIPHIRSYISDPT